MIQNHKPTLVLWADTGTGIGAGHLMRLVAIAQEWVEQGGHAILLAAQFLGRMLDPHVGEIEVRQLAIGCESVLVQAREVAGIAAGQSADWIAFDGYRFDDSIESILASTGCTLMAMDDFGHATHSYAELVVFPHVGSLHDSASANRMERQYGSTWELSGLKFVPVRKEFRDRNANRAEKSLDEPFRIAVTMGAADPENMTELVCQAVAAAGRKNPIQLDVILGPDYQHRTSLACSLDSSNLKAQLHSQVAEPGKVFAAADLVVSAGGSTLYDLASLGVPAIAVEIARNQQPVIRSMVDAGCAVGANGDGPSLAKNIEELVFDLVANPLRLCQMQSAGPIAVDGNGAARIVRRLRAGPVKVRPAIEADCEALWRLRNDQQVRANSRSTSPVDLAEHKQWFAQISADPTRHLYVLESANEKISGQCRLDIDAENASGTISVSLTDEMRGCSVAKGFVAAVVGQVLSQESPETAPAEWIAWIRAENKASLRLFESLGFVNQQTAGRNGGELLEFRLKFPLEKMNCVTGDVAPEFCTADQA